MPPFDAKIVVAAASLLAAGFMKGVSGMGLPVVATPILAALYDLHTAIAVTIPATLLTDVPILYTFRAEWRQARRLIPILLPAVVGIVVGTQILVTVDPASLRVLLGVLVIGFVLVAHFRLLPRLSERLARRIAPGVAVAAGVLQGTAGQSGPVISMYFFQLELPRPAFLFVINAFFLVVDSAQMLSLIAHGFYTPGRSAQAVAVACLSVPTLLLALRLQGRISEDLFRRAVLMVLALTGTMLVVRPLLDF